MKKVCYTAIGGGYDDPKSFNRTEGWDYILFSDVDIPKEKLKGWTLVVVDNLDLDNTRFSRYHKHNPHLVVGDYDLSLWVDANLTVVVNLDFMLEKLGDFEFVTTKHPHRDCIYAEWIACISASKDDVDTMQKQIAGYKEENFPAMQGMIQSNIIFRKHNKENIKKFSELWWNEILHKSKRDQLSFNYINWKEKGLITFSLLDARQMIFNKEFFPIQQHKHGW
jgi:hypothetical protein